MLLTNDQSKAKKLAIVKELKTKGKIRADVMCWAMKMYWEKYGNAVVDVKDF